MRLILALRLLIASEGCSQKWLAKQWGTSESTVSRFMDGSHIPEARTMFKIINWLVDDLEDKDT